MNPKTTINITEASRSFDYIVYVNEELLATEQVTAVVMLGKNPFQTDTGSSWEITNSNMGIARLKEFVKWDTSMIQLLHEYGFIHGRFERSLNVFTAHKLTNAYIKYGHGFSIIVASPVDEITITLSDI